jgi:lysophospholipase L1-like esterase
MTMGLRHFSKLMGAWLLVGGVTVVFVEVGLRLAAPLHVTGGYVGNFQYDEELGFRMKTGYFSNVTDFKQEMFVNELGTINFIDEFSGHKNLIFALGDSYTQGTGLPMDSSYPIQLDLLLNTPDGEYRPDNLVVNLGLAAYGGDQILIVYKRFRDLIGQPDVILYLGCSNDADDDRMFRSGYRHRSLVSGNPRYGMLQKPLAWLTHGTEIGKRVNYLRGVAARRRIGVTDAADRQAPSTPVAESQRESIEWLRNEAAEKGALLVVGWANGPDFGPDPGSYQWLKQWAQENNVAFADWFPGVASVRKSMPALPAENDHSSGHHRSWVNTFIARAFAKPIQSIMEDEGE